MIEEEIVQEINWRINEISILKTLPVLNQLSEEQEKTLLRYSFPALYALWEGFVCSSLEIYIREINRKNLTYLELNKKIRAHHIDNELKLSNPRQNFDKKEKFVKMYDELINKKVRISSKLPTESNINFKVLCKIFNRLNLDSIPENPYKADLDKLLLLRNKIAHGEYCVEFDKNEFSRLSQSVIDMMSEVFESISNGINYSSFLNA